MTNIGDQLYYQGKVVETIPSNTAFLVFYEFLSSLNCKCFLIAHNGKRFDNPRLIRAFQTHGMLDYFKKIVHGFCDSLPIFKQVYPDWKDPKIFP